MDILKVLMGNQSIMGKALGMLRDAFFKEGVTAVFIVPSNDMTGDTPGMSIRQFKEPVAILAGPELAEVQEYFRLKLLCLSDPDGAIIWENGKATYALAEAWKKAYDREPKEVDHV